MNFRKYLKIFSLIVLGFMGILLFFPWIVHSINHNIIAINVLKYVLHNNPSVVSSLPNQISRDASENCRSQWLLLQIIPEEKRGATLQATLDCSSDYVDILALIEPTNLSLASQAVVTYPNNTAGWLWLAEIQANNDSKAALESYHHIIQLEKSNGQAWCHIGSIYQAENNLIQAHKAFLNCCYYGDPGKHGCYGAGLVSEKMGDIRQAILDYRLSEFAKALIRADQLEKLNLP